MRRKYTKKQIATIKLIKEDPEASNYAISKKLMDNQGVKSTMYVDTLVKTSKRVAKDISIIREKNAETLSKKIVPKALKRLTEGLKTKELDLKERFPFIKLALDKEFGTDDRKRPVSPPTIHIDKIQAIIANTLNIQKDSDNSVLEVEEEKE